MSKLSSWLRFTIPALLVIVGIALNGYVIFRAVTPRAAVLFPSPTKTPYPSPEVFPSSSVITPASEPPALSTTPVIISAEPKFGHFPYAEANLDDIIIIASYAEGENQRFERLNNDAALALMKMIYAARDDGVWIVPASAFRDYARQEKLFDAQVRKLASLEAAAKSVAPPGYSEHHTGYAVDLVDGHLPRQDVTYMFAESEAFRWLTQHAQEFGYELSFPENNSQGVSYEPWHWRFVGSSHALEIFSPSRER